MFHSLRARPTIAHRRYGALAIRQRLRAAVLSLEPLEDRRLLTASYTYQDIVAGGVLYRTETSVQDLSASSVQFASNAEGAFQIQLEKSPALLANAAASAAFDMAAAYLESIFFDPITVVVDADVSVLPPNVIGSTGSERVFIGYDQLRGLMVADAQEDETLVSLLPTAAQLQSELPVDPTNPLLPYSQSGGVANRATLKALGVDESTLNGTPSQYNPSVIRDMDISFSSEFTFDYDPTDGITPGLTDFVGVAIHEIIHGLGFVSSVDYVDATGNDPNLPRQIPIGPLDMYRLRPGTGINDFTNAPRVLTPQGNAVTYDGGIYNPVGFSNIPGLTLGDIPMSTGRAFGDGQQASHWKSDDVTGVTIGIMDPTFAGGQLGVVTAQDLRALGLIGWDLIQPVPPVELSVTGFSQLEGDEGTTNFVFTVFASNSTIEEYTVDFTTIDQTATAGSDYQATSGTLTFTPEGPLTQTVTVTVFGDITVEPNESFLIRLSNASGPASISTSDAIGLILNDDVEVSIGDATVLEGHDGTRNAVFPITAFGSVNKNIIVTYTTLNGTASGATDYLPRAGQVTLTPLAPTASVTVPIVGDRLNEDTETFQVLITRTEGSRVGDGVGIGTILDDDALPSLYVNDVQVTTTASGTFAAVFSVGLDAVSGRAVTANFSTSDFGAQAGVDYAGLSGVLTFEPGVRTRTVAVPIMTSAVYSADKRFHLNLSGVQNALSADPQGMATIVFGNGPVGERIIDDGDSGYSHSSGWTALTNTLSYGLDYEYHAAGNGSGTASYTFNGLAPGSYEVYAKWIPFSNRATNAPYTILNGQATLGTVLVNQQVAPTGDVSNGVTWQKLGSYNTSTGTLIVRLGDNANGYVVADAIRLVPGAIVAQAPEINVAGLGLSINSGDTTPVDSDGTAFGSINLNNDSVAHTFTIANNGNSVLHLGGSPRVLVSGAHASDFLVTTQPAASVNPNASTNFSIVFRPTGLGLRQATVTIANDDSDEGPYTFKIHGTGLEAVSPFAHNQSLPQDVNADQRVSASDVLILVNNLLQTQTATPLAVADSTPTYYLDVNADGRVSTSDLLMVVNYMLLKSASPQAVPAATPLTAEPEEASLVLFDDTGTEIAAAAGVRVETVGGPVDSTSAASSAPVVTPLTGTAVDLALSDDDEDEQSAEIAALDWELLSLDV